MPRPDLALCLQFAKRLLGPGVALLGGHPVPRRRLGGVFLPPKALNVEIADRLLRVGIPVLRRPSVPLRRLSKPALDPEAVVVQQAEIVLGRRIAPVRARFPDAVRCGVVTPLVGLIACVGLTPPRL